MRDQSFLAAFDRHPAFRLYRGFRRSHRPLRMKHVREPRLSRRDHDDDDAENNAEPNE